MSSTSLGIAAALGLLAGNIAFAAQEDQKPTTTEPVPAQAPAENVQDQTTQTLQDAKEKAEKLAADAQQRAEKLAEELASVIMREFGAPWVRISVAKLAAIRGVQKLGIRIERGKKPKT